MNTPKYILTAFLALLHLTSAQLSAQPARELPQYPVRLAIKAPRILPLRTSGKLDLQLLDAHGRPAPAQMDLTFRVTAPEIKAEDTVVRIPKGGTSATVTVAGDQPGISRIRVEGIGAVSPFPPQIVQIAFAPAQVTPVWPPFRVAFEISPDSRLTVGNQTGTIIARLLDNNNYPAAATSTIRISFPGVDDCIDPHPLQIERGSQYGEASVSPKRAGQYLVKPIFEPARLSGSQITSDGLGLEFVRAAGLVLIADPAYMKALWWPTITVKAGLMDSNGMWTYGDQEVVVRLSVDPPGAGRFATSALTIRAREAAASTNLKFYEEGPATLSATAGDLRAAPLQIHFYFFYRFFMLLAAGGGLLGGGIRACLKKDYTRKTIGYGAFAGLVFGWLAYLLLPLFVEVSIKVEALQKGSKYFEAFGWGFVGGLTGLDLFRKLSKIIRAGLGL